MTRSVIVPEIEVLLPIKTLIVNYKCDTFDMNNENAIFGKYLTKNIWDENSANALAKMLIYLIENKLVVIKQ